MSRRLTRLAGWAACGLLGAAVLPAAVSTAAEPAPAAPVRAAAVAADPAYDVLVFSKTAGFRHSSIDEGITALRQLGTANNFTVTATEDATAFTPANLSGYEAVVFLSTTGDVLNTAQQTAFEGYIRSGGGYVGIHAAADTEYDW
ncbi:glycosyl hydrolase, partial [Streptomyces sp. SID724]|nr:glycosyl hydrolase [Streptomyces sp. SID724]